MDPAPAAVLASEVPDHPSAEEVFRTHFRNFTARDLDAIEAEYADDAVLVTTLGTFRGPREIRSFFEGFLGGVLPAEGTTIEVHQQAVEGEIGFVVWSARSPTHDLSFVTDTFVIRRGKIAAQTAAGIIRPLAG